MYPDYYQIIAKPIAMVQIKRKIGKPSYSLQQFKSDMHLLWDNARTYNEPGSWVFNAAEDMQAFFDEKYEEEVAKLEGGNGVLTSVPASATASGTSTPMYRPQDKMAASSGTKIKLNMSAKSRLAEVAPEPSEESEDEEDDDDDY